MTTITATEAEQIRVANESGKQPVVFVHGLWLLGSSWEAWKSYFEGKGYATVEADWPGDQTTVEAARANADSLAGLGAQTITDHLVEVVGALTLKPILIGHSFGGLFVQILAGLGHAKATVAIDPAPFKGVLPLPFSTLKASGPVLANPANRSKTVLLTFDQFNYGFSNAVDKDEAQSLYDAYHVPAPGRPLFQAASANLSTGKATKVDSQNPDRGPLLVISGENDHIVPRAVSHAAYTIQAKNSGRTEFLEIEGRGHSLTIDSGWQGVADAALEFLTA